jgi:hypothetical protein
MADTSLRHWCENDAALEALNPAEWAGARSCEW